MRITRAMKVRMYPDSSQQMLINRTFGCCRYVYNQMLDRNGKVYRRREEHLSGYDMCHLLPGMKKYLEWLKEPDSQALKNACFNLEDAFKRFFSGKTSYPIHHSRRGRQSYTTDRIKVPDEKHIILAKTGSIRIRGFDKRIDLMDMKIKNVTVSREPDGRYYCSICYETEIPDPEVCGPNNCKVIGLDYRIKDLYADSEGGTAGKPAYLAKELKKLRHEQRSLSRKKGNRKGEKKSANYMKQLHKVNCIHSRISHQREDFLQKQSATITRLYDVICIEALSIKDMYLTAEAEPCHRKRNNINRAIADDGWYAFTRMLAYKAEWNGSMVIKAAKDFPSSEKCCCCGHIEPHLKDIRIRKWICPECGAAHDRDVNAAVNLKNEGIRLIKMM